MFKKKRRDYKRLPGRQFFRVAGSGSFWMGRDHLLFIENYWFVESYRRLYYEDIQAITIQKTTFTNLITITLILLTALALLIAMPLYSRNIAAWLFVMLFILLLLANLWRGPSCRFFVQTAVQTVKIPSIQRLKTASKVLSQIIPLIRKEQGQLSQEDIPLQNDSTSGQYVMSPEMILENTIQESGHGVLFHKILFPLFIFCGCSFFLLIFANNVFSILLAVVLNLALALCVVGALARQDKSNTSETLRRLTWAGLIYFLLGCVLGYGLTIWAFINNPLTAQNQWGLLKYVGAISFIDEPFLLGIMSIFSIVAFGLGGAGYALQSKIQSLSERSAPVKDKIEHEFDISLPD